MTDGLKEKHRSAIVGVLAADDKVERAVLFGSRAVETFTPASDVDLVLFGDRLTLTDAAKLAAGLEKLAIPQRIDLLLQNEITNKALRRHIEKDGVEWYSNRCNRSIISQDWREMPFTEAFLVNPPIRIERGNRLPFVDMAAVYPDYRSVYSSETREFRGSGSRFQDGDTLMARITPCLENGKIARYCAREALKTAHGSTEFIVVRGRPEITDTDFAFYVTKSSIVRDYAIGQMTGTSGRQRVPAESLKHLTISVPTLSEQRAIARILGTLDDKIELNRRMNETLEAMARALFRSWFVDFDPVRAKMAGRDPALPPAVAALFPNRMVNSELGQIPEGWEKSAIGEEVEVVGGSTPSTKDRSLWDGNINWATPKDLSTLSAPVLLETARRISNAGLAKISSGLLPKGTVLMSSRAPVGYLAIADVSVAVNQGFIAMKCEHRLSNMFVWLWVQENMDAVLQNANGSTFQEISKRNFRPLRVVVPELGILTAFDKLIRPLYERIAKNQHESRAIARIRDILLPDLISGELQSRDVNLPYEERSDG